jgi:hypothetical protein
LRRNVDFQPAAVDNVAPQPAKRLAKKEISALVAPAQSRACPSRSPAWPQARPGCQARLHDREWSDSDINIPLGNNMLSRLINEWTRGETDFELVPDAVVMTVLDAWSSHPGRDG